MKRKLTLAVIISLLSSGLIAQEAVSVTLPDNPLREEVVRLATKVRPSYRQLDYQQREMLGFIHIGMNTFTGAEWGTGKEDPSLFNPSQLDADKWVKTFKDAGISGVILVAKHHDGFCVWPSKYTSHTVANSPWRNGKGDLVKEVADACRKYDMKLCLYLSPWDMHEKTYGTEAYNDYYIHQLEELLTGYGPVYLLWFDGAGTTNDVSGVEMPFDWERIFRKARELQPDVLHSGNAPDIRWVGNEKGKGRETEWCVQGINNTETLFGSLTGYNPTLHNLGSIDDLMKKKRLVWYPSRGGLPLRKGWFYNKRDDDNIKSLKYLVDSYFETIGQNANLLPNLSPDPTGRIPEKDANRLIQFGKIISRMKQTDYAKGATVKAVSGWEGSTPSDVITDDTPFTSWHTPNGTTAAVAEVQLRQPAMINVIKLQENVRDFGQRVERFAIDVWTGNGWKEITQSTTIGFRKMLRLSKPITADKFRIRFTDARVSVSWGNLSMYYLEQVLDEVEQKQKQKVVPPSDIQISLSGITSLSNDGYKALVDGNTDTRWEGKAPKLPAAFIFKLKSPRDLSGFSYLPIETSMGYIENYAIYISGDGVNWGKPAKSGRFGNITNNPVEQVITLNADKVRYLKFEVLGTTSNVHTFTIADLRLFEK